VEIVTDCVVSPPGDQLLPVAEDEVNVTSSPWQNVIGPEAVIVGTGGALGSFRACVNVFETQPVDSVNVIE
jgi:hypothetical protein